MDGFTLLFVYGIEFLSPFPTAALPITVTHRMSPSEGSAISTQAWSYAQPDWIQMQETRLENGTSYRYEHIEYRIDARNNVIETDDYHFGSYPLSYSYFTYTDGKVDSVRYSFHFGESSREKFIWDGSQLLRSIYQTKRSGQAVAETTEYQWMGGNLAAIYTPNDTLRYEYPSHDSITYWKNSPHPPYARMQACIQLKDGRPVRKTYDGEVWDIVYGEQAGIRRPATAARKSGTRDGERNILGRRFRLQAGGRFARPSL